MQSRKRETGYIYIRGGARVSEYSGLDVALGVKMWAMWKRKMTGSHFRGCPRAPCVGMGEGSTGFPRAEAGHLSAENAILHHGTYH